MIKFIRVYIYLVLFTIQILVLSILALIWLGLVSILIIHLFTSYPYIMWSIGLSIIFGIAAKIKINEEEKHNSRGI